MKRLYKKSLYKIFVSLFVVFYSFVPQVLAIDEVINELQETNAAPIEEEIIPEESLLEEEVVLPEEEIPPIVEEPIVEPKEVIKEVMSYPVWVINGDSAVTSDVVELGKTYIAPQNSRVRIIFTKLPENPSKLTIEEITLTQEEINATGAVSDKAYDITADMIDGTFEYDLVLPSVEDGIKVVYAEDRDSILTDLKEVKNEIVNEDNSIEIKDLDHFTLFIVTNPGPKLSTVMVNGQPYVTVPPNTSVNVKMTVTTSGSNSEDDWRSSQYLIEGGSWTCVNTGNHTGDGTYTDDFDLIAPASVGTYDLSLRAYNGDDCTGGVSIDYVMSNAITVATPAPALTPPTLTDNPSDPIALTSVGGVWTSISGGSGYQGVGTNEIRWGTPAGTQKSGLRFTNSGNQSFKTGDTFYLGMLTHMNWPTIHGTAATGAKLQITLDFNRPDIDNAVFSYDFRIEETPNSEGDCPIYQRTLTPCDDKVTFPNSYGTTVFTIGDIIYTLVIDGFVNAYPTGTAVDAFITEEKKDNSAFLVGHLSSVLVERPQITLTKKVNDQDVSAAPGPNLYIGDSVTWQYIVQNTGNVDLTNVTVVDNPSANIDCDLLTEGNQNSGLTLASGATMTCTATGTVQEGAFSNTATVVGTYSSGTVTASDTSYYNGIQKSHLIVQKTTLPADDSTNFDISLSTSNGEIYEDANGIINDATDYDYTVSAGTYSVLEDVKSGWGQTSNTCTNVEVGIGETVSCTITNSKLPVLTVEKVLIGETVSLDTFSFAIDGGSSNQFETDGSNDIFVVPDSDYVITEVNPSSIYNVTYSDDCSGNLTYGETATCTITNTEYATLTIVKNANPDSSQDFSFLTSGTGLSVFSLDDDTDGTLSNTKTFTNLLPGTYSVTESTVSGWDLTNAVCSDGSFNTSINLSAGEDVTCTFTNTMRGAIGGHKYNDADGDILTTEDRSGLGGWTVELYQNDQLKASTTTASDGTYGFSNLVSGEYKLKEVLQDGWFALHPSSTGDGFINVTLSPGENDFANNFINTQGASITIYKNIDTDGDGDIDENHSTSWKWNIDSTEYSTGTIVNNLYPSSYTISEQQQTGYHVSSLICNNGIASANHDYGAVQSQTITLSSGQNLVCTFTNTRDTGTIELKKVWSGTPGQTNLNIGTTVGGSEIVTVQTGASGGTPLTTGQQTVSTGTYYLSESGGLESYTKSPLSCFNDTDNDGSKDENESIVSVDSNDSVSVAIGNHIVCSYTNTRQQGTIIVKKVMVGGTDTFTFTGTPSGTISTNEGTLSVTVDTGSYTTIESDLTGWKLTNISCNDGNSTSPSIGDLANKKATFNIEPGETVECIFTNEMFGSVTAYKYHDFNKDGNQDAGEPGLSGWNMTLYTGSNCEDGNSMETKSTDINGNATFSSIIPGQGYSIKESQKDGWENVSDMCQNFTVTAGEAGRINFGNIQKPITIKAHKIVCTDESQLPNWGAGGPNITATTAQDWVNSHNSCTFVGDWNFQWGNEGSSSSMNPGDNTGETSDIRWHKFGPTVDGLATVEINANQFSGFNSLWMREVWNSNYIPFTYNIDGNNSNHVTAEIYCHTDVLNYDNLDRIDNIKAGETYYCVAWNVESKEDLSVTKTVDWAGITPDSSRTFEICISGPSYPNGDCKTSDYDGEVLIWTDLLVGGYTVTETDPGSHWSVTGSGNTITVGHEIPATHTVVNTYKPYCGDGVINQESEQCDGKDGVSANGSNFCTSQCKLIPIYNGANSCAPGTTPVKVGDTHILGSQDSDGVDISLSANQEYLFKVSGTYQFGSNANRQADAAYGTENNWNSTRDDLGIWGTSYKGVLSVLANLGAGVGVVIWDNDSVYNSPHVYQKAFTPSDAMSAQFLISDWYDGWYGDSCDNQGCMNDNSGSLELEVYECQAFGSIQGRKYYDVNINGDFDQFEKEQLGDPNRLNGWTIELYDEEWVFVNSMVTGDDTTPAGNVDKGQYRFIDVVPGTYNICEESREGWYQTEPSTGIQHNNLFCHTVTVDPGQAIDTIQFGNYQGSDVNICKKDNYDRGLQDWKVILASEQVQSATSINVSNGSGTKSSSLPAGTYLIKVSGTYKYGNSQMIADAGYSFRPMGIPSGTGGWVSGLDLPSNGLMAWVNENPVNWGAYNDAHQYSYVYEHTGGSVNISIYDDYYGDNINNNNFVFEVYEVNDWAEDTTGENGCVVLDAVPYGEYILDEFLKDGWVDMSGKGDTVKVNDLTEDFTIKNRIDAPVTIKATKIVCDYEEDLPNWGAVKSDGNPITQDRINQFLTDTGGKCRVVPDWEFEWGYQGANNPGDDLVGYGGDNWNTFTSSVQINQLQGGRLEFREVLQENYIPFTYASNGNNSDNFSAEFYCHNDVMNYDNWEWLNTPEYGQTYYCVGFNTLTRTDVHGYKWLDIDRDGDRSCIQEEPSNILEQVREILFDEGQSECEEDDLEPRLSGWKIFIDTNKDGKWDEGEQYMLTSSNTEDSDQFGSYLFEDLLPGEYKICEEMPDEGWAQTYPGKPTEPSCHIITLPNDCNNSESCEFNFGNVEESELYISETNDSWPNILGIGDTFKYTITVRAEKGPLTNVVLVNLPPKGIIPQLGTFSAVSSEGYILDTSGVIYASPGTWNLGNLKKDETVTITYIAKVTDEIDSGIYPDLSYAYGTGVAGSSIFALSEGSGFEIDDGIVTKNYVGTQIQIGEEPEIEEGEVLGTSIELPATGAQTYLTLGAILSMILGFILLVFNPKRKIKNLLMVGILLLGISTVVKPTEIYAISPEVEVQIEQPASPTKEDTFKIGFVALDLNGRDIKVQCYVNGIPFGPEYATNSGNCEVTPSIITSSGIYNFYVKATPDGGTSRDSSIVSVQVTLEKPLPVTNYVKTEGVCTYTLTFKTANDTRTSKVEIFRSSTQPFTANASTRIHTETVGPNKDVSYTDTSIIDCSKEYYYAIRALDDLGNFSTFVTDNIVTITQAPTTGTTTTTVTVNGETGEVAGEETTAGEETEGENGTGAEDENGDVKGDEESVVDDSEENEDKSIESIWDKYKYVIIAAGVVVLGSAGYSYVRRKK